ncbi:MAG: hypothetical protein L0027_15660, partial [Candidatus Rokubacteria bacterium]|nr:hypothetical protein [Candidatus Rokubacteria bacterium]
MADRRVVVHFMDEAERRQAESLLADVEATDSFVVGMIEGARVADLRAQGLPVRELEEAPPPPLRPVAGDGIVLASATPEAEPALPAFYILGVPGPVLPAWQQELEAAGVDLFERLPHDRFKVRLTDRRQVQALRAMRFVRELRPYHPSEARPGPV